ncbi:MAG TPA: S9 family peptidase [Thermomicrobiaceae bacterium]|nr:S9 family peptidase [Thermomicrobiaceae bacterium]
MSRESTRSTQRTRIDPSVLVYDLQTPNDPQISPDGSRIVYSLAGADREARKATAQLWLCDRDGGNRLQLTASGRQNTGARWSPDGRQIAFVSDRVAAPAKAGIFVLPVDSPGEARQLTAHNQGVADLAWSPDGGTIAYTTTFDPENPDEEPPKEGEPARIKVTRRLDYKMDGRGYLGDARTQVWTVDVASGERRRLTGDPVDHNQPVWSPDGRTLAVRRQTEDGWTCIVALVDLASGKIRPAGDVRGTHPTAAWSPGGDRLIVTGDPVHTYQPDLYLVDVASGETRRLTDDLAILPAEGVNDTAMVWLDERRVLINAVEHARHGLYVLDVEAGQLECLVSQDATTLGLSVDAARRTVVQAYASFESAGEICVHDLDGDRTAVVTHYGEDVVAAAGPAGWERFEIARGGFTTESWLLKPADFDPSKRYPVVLMIHGGPNSFYGYRFLANQQLLANHGYLVVLPNPRGSTSYGREFTVQVLGDRGGEDYLDLMAVADHVAALPYVDAERFGIFGYSYGGFMTSWMLGQTTRFTACVCGAPSVDLASQFGTSDIGWHYDTTQYRSRPHEQPEWYRAHSPITYAHRATTPTLLVSGEADLRCPTSQAEELFVALKKAGCEVEFVRYPGVEHGFASAGPLPYREDFLARTLAWFDHYLGDA